MLLKHQQCASPAHSLQWGVQPISLPNFSPESLLLYIKVSGAPPKQRVADNMHAAWREEPDFPPRIFRAVSRWQDMQRDLDAIAAAIAAGKLNTPINGLFFPCSIACRKAPRLTQPPQTTTWAFATTAWSRWAARTSIVR